MTCTPAEIPVVDLSFTRSSLLTAMEAWSACFDERLETRCHLLHLLRFQTSVKSSPPPLPPALAGKLVFKISNPSHQLSKTTCRTAFLVTPGMSESLCTSTPSAASIHSRTQLACFAPPLTWTFRFFYLRSTQGERKRRLEVQKPEAHRYLYVERPRAGQVVERAHREERLRPPGGVVMRHAQQERDLRLHRVQLTHGVGGRQDHQLPERKIRRLNGVVCICDLLTSSESS